MLTRRAKAYSISGLVV